MTNGFGVDPGSLPATASALLAAGAAMCGLARPGDLDAGRSSGEIAAAVLELVQQASSVGSEISQLAAAFEDAARAYTASDDAVAASLSRWTP